MEESAATPIILPRNEKLAAVASQQKLSACAIKEHCKFVAAQPCLVCGRSPTEAHHIRFAQPRAFGRKVSDEYTGPDLSTPSP
jgi:hypothetical protein